MLNQQLSEVLNHPLLAPHKEIILASAKPTVSIELTRQDKGLTLWQSKVGGDPYLPKGADYPRHPDGHALTLLAQINFAEVPKLPDFPEKGILQFFIDGTDEEYYGMNWDNRREQTSFRVVYYADVSENIDDLVTDFSPYAVKIYEYGLPFKGQYAMAFALQEQFVPSGDVGIDNQLVELLNNDEFYDAYTKSISSKGHRVGGYPWFTQDDPRYYFERWEYYSFGSSENSPNNEKVLEEYVLLFQLDSEWNDNEDIIMWGDAGVANFFIHPDDLKNLDFSKVLYTWDCC